jgi:hypothetical protein
MGNHTAQFLYDRVSSENTRLRSYVHIFLKILEE